MKLSSCTITSITAGIAIVTACVQAHAQATSPEPEPEPLALRKIMQQMGRDMRSITDAISREDWALVAKTAPLIAKHPQPPMVEKARILSYVGSNAGRFKAFDDQTHKAANALADAAVRADGTAVIQAFAAVQSACLACHQNFRKPFVEHFYGKD